VKVRKRVGLIARGVMAGGLLVAPLAGCFGETSTTGESAPVCVDLDPAVAEGGHRLVAAYLDPYEPVDDVPITQSRTCFTVRPKRLRSEEPAIVDMLRLPLTPILPKDRSSISLEARHLELAIYTDGDRDGRFTPAGPEGGPDHIAFITVGSYDVGLVWLPGLEAALKILPQHQVAEAIDATAQGRPFALIDRSTEKAVPWSTPLTLEPRSDSTCWSHGWSLCSRIDIFSNWLESTWADPRVPRAHFRDPPEGTEAEVMGPVDRCVQYGKYLIADSYWRGPQRHLSTCECEVDEGIYYRVALADAPPAWLVCPDPTEEEQYPEDLARAAGLDVDAIEAESWWSW
jgi:hypothetical protein